MRWIASAAFGLEGLVKRDLERLGAGGIRTLPTGGVSFEGDGVMGFQANLWLRTADRVMIEVGRFEARSFEALFEGVKALDWPDFLPRDAAFPVRAQCARSILMSPRDCQSIAKKAVVEKLKAAYRVDWLPETGATYAIDVSIHEDEVVVALDASGPALSRRGYRTWNGEAPLRETLAAAIALLSPWRPSLPLYDPCCGTGTILIEAALIALDRAPGLMRSFDCENWAFMPRTAMAQAREAATARHEAAKSRPLDVRGSDIDPEALELATRHVAQAGLTGRIKLEKCDVRDASPGAGFGAIVTNPPYGERMGDARAARAVAEALGNLQRRSGWALSALTADRGFERAFGRRADKRRRLYNGRIECEFITFSGGSVK
jgi:putative N6-adenine-specific DNA methylase